MKEQMLYDLASDYLIKRIGENAEETLNYYLNLYTRQRLNSLSNTCQKMLEHLKNRQAMPNSIGNIDHLGPLLYNFDPHRISNNFQTWESIFYHIKANYNPPGKMDATSSKNYWVIFSKGIFTSAKFLGRFSSFSDFQCYCDSFIKNTPDVRLCLPLILKEEIFGMGFALACDFLKEWVSPQFVKPDTHIKTIFVGTGVCSSSDSDFNVCRRLIEYSSTINKVPYEVDRLFWLIGSGKLFETSTRTEEVKFQTSKKEFVQLYKLQIEESA